MLLTPRYATPPVIAVEVRSPGDHPVIAQRQRLVAELESLSDAQWAHPSRCEGWTVQDVVAHLVSTNGFWALSMQAGLAGEPTRFLAAFDPVATPAQLAERERGTAPHDTHAQLVASNAALAEVVSGLDAAGWDTIAEAPPGHLPIRLVADHALWDAWVHERDILLPLGRTPVEEPSEVLTSLRYGAALGRAFELCRGGAPTDPVVLETEDPAAEVVVVVDGHQVRVQDGPGPADALRCRAPAVELLEMLSTRDLGRTPPPEVGLLTEGLATVFDQPSSVPG